MISLDSILVKELKFQDINSCINELAQTKLYADFSKAISLIDTQLKAVNRTDSTQYLFRIGHLIQLSLIKCQLVIERLDKNKKEKILKLTETILSRLYAEILLKLSHKERAYFIKNMEQLWRETAFFFNLKHYPLNRLCKFWSIIENRPNNSNGYAKRVCGLIWNDKRKDSFENFLNIIHQLKVAEKSEFKRLFNMPEQCLNLELNATNPDFVLQFLCCLKESKLISHYNTRGFYQVFRHHVKNFDLVFLRNKTPQRRVDIVKNHVSWVSRKAQIDELLKALI